MAKHANLTPKEFTEMEMIPNAEFHLTQFLYQKKTHLVWAIIIGINIFNQKGSQDPSTFNKPVAFGK